MKQLTQEELDTIKKCLKGHKYTVRYINEDPNSDFDCLLEDLKENERLVWIDQYDIFTDGGNEWYDSDRLWMLKILDILAPNACNEIELTYTIDKEECEELERFASGVGIFGEDAEPREVEFSVPASKEEIEKLEEELEQEREKSLENAHERLKQGLKDIFDSMKEKRDGDEEEHVYRFSKEKVNEVEEEKFLPGTKIAIMKNIGVVEKTGIIKEVDEYGFLHGTWGNEEIMPGVDDIEIVR